jgi:2-keto-3-deoxy-L-rhamnonate aldolase RhmA
MPAHLTPSLEGKHARKSMEEKLAAGGLVLCLNLRLARCVDIAMVAKAGGSDALYVDMQHAPYSIETTATMCAAALGIGIAPLVRAPNHDAPWMSRVLDGGAQGAILPDVNTRARPKRSSAHSIFHRWEDAR